MRRSVEPDYRLDKEKFGTVLKAAIGNRSTTAFAKEADVSFGYLSKYLNKREEKNPTIQTIKKIASKSAGPGYKDLLEAAGYDSSKYPEMDKKVSGGANMQPALKALLPSLCKTGFEWSMTNKDVRGGGPVSAKVADAPFDMWYFIPVEKEDVTKEDILAILGSKEAETIAPKSKVTFITIERKTFEQIKRIELLLISLRISVAFVSEETGLISDEKYLKTAIVSDNEGQDYMITDGAGSSISPLLL